MTMLKALLEKNEKLVFPFLALLALLWLLLYNQIQAFADWLTYSLMGLSSTSHLGMALNFFFYDVPKILLLLVAMIFLISLLQSFIHIEKLREMLEKRGEGIGNLIAALFGALTPFCSCSSVPLFIGFVQAGIPLGMTFSFLVSSPIMNEVAFVMLLGMFGWKVAVLYLLSGILIGTVSGIILGRMKLERYVEPFVYDVKAKSVKQLSHKPSWYKRLDEASHASYEIFAKVWLYVIIGIAIGAFIHGFVPEDALVSLMGEAAWWAVPLAVLLGIPLYSNAAGVIPIVSALLAKGAALGTALGFMMSVVALSLPEMIILRRVLKPQLIGIFITVVAAAIIFTAYLFNFLF